MGSLCRPSVTFFGKNVPTEGWPLETSEGGALVVLLQLGRVPGPILLQGQGKTLPRVLCWPLPPITHDTQPSSRGPKHAAAETQAQMGAPPSSSGGRSAAGWAQGAFPGRVGTRGKAPPLPHLPGSLLFRDQTGLGIQPEKKSS